MSLTPPPSFTEPDNNLRHVDGGDQVANPRKVQRPRDGACGHFAKVRTINAVRSRHRRMPGSR